MTGDGWKPTADQALVLATPPDVDLCLAGPRGWGKTDVLVALALRACLEYGIAALLIRRTYAALLDLEDLLCRMAEAMVGGGATYRRTDKTLHLPGGGRVGLSQMESREHYNRFQGLQFAFVGVDEVTQFASPELVDLLRASLRPPEGVPGRFIVAGNYSGPGLSWFRHRYISGRPLWLPYVEETSGRQFVSCAGDYRNNPHIDADAYERQLAAAAGGRDTPLFKAWSEGDPDVVEGGAFFEGIDLRAVELDPDCWSPAWFAEVNSIPPTGKFPSHKWWSTWSIDHGYSAACVALLAARPPYHGPITPDGRHLHRDSWVLLDEVALSDPNDPRRGLRLDVPDVAHYIHAASDKWGVPPEAILDSACWQQHGQSTLAEEYNAAGVRVSPSRKGSRVGGWARLRRLLTAGPDEPQLLISRRCRYLLQTMHDAPRCPKNGDDIDSSSADHGLDAARYLIETEAADDTLEAVWL